MVSTWTLDWKRRTGSKRIALLEGVQISIKMWELHGPTFIQLRPEGPRMTPPTMNPNIGGRDTVVQIQPRAQAHKVMKMRSWRKKMTNQEKIEEGLIIRGCILTLISWWSSWGMVESFPLARTNWLSAASTNLITLAWSRTPSEEFPSSESSNRMTASMFRGPWEHRCTSSQHMDGVKTDRWLHWPICYGRLGQRCVHLAPPPAGQQPQRHH